MSKDWYPMINYERCIECGLCVEMCAHGVYDESKSPTPVVIFPEGCVSGCKGCAGECPSDAIAYFGDSEDVPVDNAVDCEGGCCGSSGEISTGGCGSGCSSGESTEEQDGEETDGCGCSGGCC